MQWHSEPLHALAAQLLMPLSFSGAIALLFLSWLKGMKAGIIRVRSRNHQPQLRHASKSSGIPSRHITGNMRGREHHGSTALEQLAAGSLQIKDRTTTKCIPPHTHTRAGGRPHNLAKTTCYRAKHSQRKPKRHKAHPPTARD